MVSKKVSTGFPEARGVGYILVRRTGLCDPEVGAGVGRRLFTSPLTITRKLAGDFKGTAGRHRGLEMTVGRPCAEGARFATIRGKKGLCTLPVPIRPFTQTREAYKLFKPPPSFLFQHQILTCCKGVVGVQVSIQVRRKRPALEQENR